MYNGHFNRTTFIKARVGQSIDHQATNLNDVGSNPTVGKMFLFLFCRFRRAPGRSTGPIQMKSNNTFIRSNKCIERTIMVVVLVTITQ